MSWGIRLPPQLAGTWVREFGVFQIGGALLARPMSRGTCAWLAMARKRWPSASRVQSSTPGWTRKSWGGMLGNRAPHPAPTDVVPVGAEIGPRRGEEEARHLLLHRGGEYG